MSNRSFSTKNVTCRAVAVAAVLAAWMSVQESAQAQSTAFTYQGHLKQNGSPASGSFNMAFKLFDALSGGTQQGSTLTFDGAGGNPAPVSVTSGLFTVQLDFGVSPYTANQNRWLEIAVSGTTLAPLQALTPAPFALNTRGLNVGSTGNVGIGTTTPAQKLSVAGMIESTSGGIKFPDGTAQATAATGGAGFWTPSGANIFNNNSGNVGIGTSSPTSLLDVRGVLTLDAGGDAAIFTGTGNSELNRYLSLLNSSGFQSASGLRAGGILCSDDFFYANPGKNDLVVKGSAAIGTPTPVFPFALSISTSFPAYGWVHTDGTRRIGSYVDATGGWLGTTSNHPLKFFTNDSTGQMELNTSGNLGIGTSAPVRRLHALASDLFAARFESSHTTASVVEFRSASSNSTWEYGVTGSSSAFGFPAGTAYFYRQGAGSPNLSMTPDGRTRVNVLEILGADLAEKFPCSNEGVEPGTVMEIDPEHPGKLRIARGSYCPRVAGVVSGAGDLPVGAVLGHLPGHEDAPPIALSGRVWVKCDASASAINPGDMLTTSSTSGHAMKAIDRDRSHGAVIGKAMSRLKKGEMGLVLVLVNLQ